MRRSVWLVAALAALLLAAPVDASFPGRNGQILYFSGDQGGDWWKINPDGSGEHNFTLGQETFGDPDWSPDGSKIAHWDFEGIWVMNADGTGRTKVIDGPNLELEPSWSPDGLKIAYTERTDFASNSPSQILIANADGSDPVPLQTSFEKESHPKWHPDGTRIAFRGCSGFDCTPLTPRIVNVDGTGEGPLPSSLVDFSPDGTKMVFPIRCDPEECGDRPSLNSSDLWVQNMDGTGLENITNSWAPHGEPTWSPDGTKIAVARGTGPGLRLVTLNADGSGGLTQINSRVTQFPIWQPIHPYARPKGATPFRASLTIAYEPCTAPNRTHGPPLAFASCNPPQQASDFLTVGTADANAKPALNEGYLKLASQPGVPGGADDADVGIDFFIDDVFTKPALADYTGELHVRVPLTITDRDSQRTQGGEILTVVDSTPIRVNTAAPHEIHAGRVVTITGVANAPCANGTWTVKPDAVDSFVLNGSTACGNSLGGSWSSTETGFQATTSEAAIEFPVTCVAVPDAQEGSSCVLATSMDAIVPGAVQEGKRAMWALGSIEVYDGGADGDAQTPAGDTLLATQGIFIP